MITRRELLVTAGAYALTPAAVLAQQPGPRVFRVGFLSLTSRWEAQDAFVGRLRELGYVDGRNLIIHYRFANGSRERLFQDARELALNQVDAILAVATAGAIAAQQATSTIPIVFVFATDPVGAGFANSLAQPGRNMTGLEGFHLDLMPKRLGILKEAIPKLVKLGVIVHTLDPLHQAYLKAMESAARVLQIQLRVVAVEMTAGGLDSAFSTLVREGVQGFTYVPSQVFFVQRNHIAELALKMRLPGVGDSLQLVESGFLLAYGINYAAQYRRGAEFVDKILRGAKPGEIPVEQPTELDLAVSLQTAKSLGIKVPDSILVQATKVIE